MQDSYLHKGRRRILVEYLRDKIGITDEKVLSAINQVPRHIFFDSVFDNYAYEDRAFPIVSNQTISHPSTVAEQTELLNLSVGEKVLEIGTGSGYQTLVLIAMGVKVYTIERQQELVKFSRKIFETLNIFPERQVFGDGFAGMPEDAPFDKILVTCGAETLPIELLRQLKVGGLMVIPLGEDDEQKLTRFRKISETKIEKEEFGVYKFVPMLKDTN